MVLMCMSRYERGQLLSTTSSWALIKLHSQELYQALHFPNLLGHDNCDCLAEHALELCSLHLHANGETETVGRSREEILSSKVTRHEWVRRGTEPTALHHMNTVTTSLKMLGRQAHLRLKSSISI